MTREDVGRDVGRILLRWSKDPDQTVSAYTLGELVGNVIEYSYLTKILLDGTGDVDRAAERLRRLVPGQ